MSRGDILVLGVAGWVLVIFLTLVLLSMSKQQPPPSPLARELAKAEAERAAAAADVHRHQARIANLVRLHRPVDGKAVTGGVRAHCHTCDVAWPCTTITALSIDEVEA